MFGLRAGIKRLTFNDNNKKKLFQIDLFSVKGDWTSLAVGQRDGGIAIWNLSSADEVKPRHSQLLWGHPGQPVSHLKFHPGGDLLASLSSSLNQGTVCVKNSWPS